MKKRNLKSLALNKVAISNLKGGESADESYNCYETYSCEDSIPFPYTHHMFTECPSVPVTNTLGIGCVPHGPSVAGDC